MSQVVLRRLRVSLLGGSAPKPPGFFRFFPPEWGILLSRAWGGSLAAAPAAAPVARVASQQSSIASDAGRLIMD